MAPTEQGTVVRGGTLVDGTGAPPVRGDVRVAGGRIVEIGPDLPVDGDVEVDASGAHVAPGLIDLHTHMDPSLWWDPAADPLPSHGVTTVVQGNCSLSLAPLRPEHRELLLDCFAFIEDLPVAAMETGIPWDWTDWASYRDRIDGHGAAINVVGFVGHTALRLDVMGAASYDRAADDRERAAIRALLRECLDAGAWGLSTSFADVDRYNRPVPSRLADDAELAELAEELGAHGQAVLQFLPRTLRDQKFADLDKIAALCAANDLHGTYAQIATGGLSVADVPRYLAQAGRTQTGRAGIFPQVSPRSFDVEINLERTGAFAMQPAWHQWVQQDHDTKRRLLADPAWRDGARAEWDAVPYSLFPKGRMHKLLLSGVQGSADPRYLGQAFTALAADHPGEHEADVFADWVLANDLEPGLTIVGLANDDPAEVGALLADPRIVVGGSDAGAHLLMMCGAGDTTLLFERFVRDRADLTIEHAVNLVTGRVADVLRMTDRGRLAVGAAADLVVLDLDDLHYGPLELVHDLPDGSARFTRGPGGFRTTIVAGEVTQQEGRPTGACPGRFLRSARRAG